MACQCALPLWTVAYINHRILSRLDYLQATIMYSWSTAVCVIKVPSACSANTYNTFFITFFHHLSHAIQNAWWPLLLINLDDYDWTYLQLDVYCTNDHQAISCSNHVTNEHDEMIWKIQAFDLLQRKRYGVKMVSNYLRSSQSVAQELVIGQ